MLAPAPAAAQGRGAGESPASKKPPATVTPQSYPPEQIQAGETRFIAQCGFCHGRDAGGGESGPDLIRSTLVAEDVRGDKIGPVIRQGRPDKGMPGSNLSDADIAAMVAFIHDAKVKAESAGGGRRSVDVEDLQTGNAEAGRRYFNGAGGCAKCHSLTGDFAKVGLALRGARAAAPPALSRIRSRRGTGAGEADGDGDDQRGTSHQRHRGLSRRVHDLADRRERLDAIVADQAGAHRRSRTRFTRTSISSANIQTRTCTTSSRICRH